VLCVPQTFVTVPNAVHATAFPGRSPWGSSNVSCSLIITGTFFLGQTDTSCLSSLTPLDFAGATTQVQDVSEAVLGVRDMWGSGSY
jgi:hypothetical protein